jgi:molybdopterin/thiamine biosynthesis adenylyltransferase
MLLQDQLLRYSRQIILSEIGHQGQEKLLDSKVLVVGAGGLGSPALYYLAAAGIGTLGIADFDVVGISNLQRQILHSTGDLGQKKTESAAEKLRQLNPELKIITFPQRVTVDNVAEIIAGFDLVIDAADNFSTRFLVSDCCYFMKKPLIEGAVLGFEGVLMTILPDQSHCYRCLYPAPPDDGVVPTCSEAGILGMIAGTIGSLQALEAVKVLLTIGDTLTSRIITFDGLGLNFREIPWPKRAACPLCGENPIIKDLTEYNIQCKTKIVVDG